MAEQVFYEIARWRLDEQLGQIRELNSRLAVLFTATTALLVLFAAFQDFTDLGPATIALLAGGAMIYLMLVFVIFLAYADRQLSLNPDLRRCNKSVNRPMSLTCVAGVPRKRCARLKTTMRGSAGKDV